MKKVAEILKAERLSKNITIEEISKNLKIHSSYLTALEESDYAKFNNTVQIKGFIKNYANFLGLDSSSILAFFRREYDEKLEDEQNNKLPQHLKKSVFIFTPKTFLNFGLGILTFIFLLYIGLSYKKFSAKPFLALESPSTDTEVTDGFINVYGKTEKEAELTLNGQKVNTDMDGKFAINVSLSEGINQLNFVSLNKVGKESSLSRKVLWKGTVKKEGPLENKETVGQENEEGVVVTLEITKDASYLTVFKDNVKTFEGIVLSGVKLTFLAKDEIKITSGNAGAVKVTKNGNDLGILGKDGEVIEKTFTN